MLPSIYSENLFDDFFSDPFDMVMPRSLNALYGKHGKNLMKTDVRETEDTYELDIDLPGFKKEEVNLELKDGYLTIQAAKGLDKEEPKRRVSTSVRSVTPVRAAAAFMSVSMWSRRTSARSSKTASCRSLCRRPQRSSSRRAMSLPSSNGISHIPQGSSLRDIFCSGTLRLRTEASQSLRSQAQRK